VNPWPYKTSTELAEAGYVFRDRIRCPLCRAPLDIYQRAGEMPVFIDQEAYTLHLSPPVHAEQPPAPPISGKDAAAGER
jgi:hypothetical protein